MALFTLALFIVAGVYFALSMMLTAGIARLGRNGSGGEPPVTVVIPARNEERNIHRCLSSISALDYPRDRLQVIVIDDHSTDGTAAAAGSFAGRLPGFSLVLMDDIAGAGEGKRAALIQGFRRAEGDIIVQTDADCIVPAGWIRALVRRFDGKTGIAGGMTVMRNFDKRNTCFTRIQSLDWLYLLSVGAGAAGLGIPLSCIGNNLAVRRSAYDAAGGYEDIPFSVTEDFALFQAVVRAGWGCGFSLEEDSLVHSSPQAGVRGFFLQRLRWASGGIRLAGAGVVLLAAAFLMHLGVLLGIILGAGAPALAAAFAVSAAGDLVFLFAAAKRINRLRMLVFFPLYELFYYCYTTVIGIVLPFVSSISWKARKIQVK